MDKSAGLLVQVPRDEFFDDPSQNVVRDAALCPEHARAVESQLKDFR